MDAPPFVIELLAAHLARVGRHGSEEFVFTAPGGGPIRATNFRSRIWNPAVRAAGLDGFTFHGLRHSYAGLLREVGAHPQSVRQRLGHSGGGVTEQVYSWTTPASEKVVTDGLEAHFRGVRGLSAASSDDS